MKILLVNTRCAYKGRIYRTEQKAVIHSNFHFQQTSFFELQECSPFYSLIEQKLKIEFFDFSL